MTWKLNVYMIKLSRSLEMIYNPSRFTDSSNIIEQCNNDMKAHRLCWIYWWNTTQREGNLFYLIN